MVQKDVTYNDGTGEDAVVTYSACKWCWDEHGAGCFNCDENACTSCVPGLVLNSNVDPPECVQCSEVRRA